MEEQETQLKEKIYRDRFIRWQQLTIKQFSYTNNLFLGLSLASLGFFFTQNGLNNSNCLIFTFIFISFTALTISFSFGIFTVLYRLADFRATHQLVKYKRFRFENRGNKSEANLQITKYQSVTDKMGGRTWICLNWQIWTYFIGVIFGIISLLLGK